MAHFGIAAAIAAEIHVDQFDKGGKAYILHVMRVALRLRTTDDELMCIAIMHDVLEDGKGKVTIESLKEKGFSDRVIEALKLLTHDKDVDYMEYVEKISKNYDALRVKMEDLKDNSDITRLKGLREKDFQRMEKYARAYAFLQNVRKQLENDFMKVIKNDC